MIKYDIRKINSKNISSIESFIDEAVADGHNFVKKTIDEWKSGENTFSKPRETFFGLFIKDKCIAIGGLNIDSYYKDNDGSIGRVRHVYVAKKYRGQGLSRVILNIILDKAKKENFKLLRLSTSNPVAASLYESLGFIIDKTETKKSKNPDRKCYILNFSKENIDNLKSVNWKKVEKILIEGGVAVIPTDTLYGLVASVYNKKAIEKVYKIKERDKSKPLIVLISSVLQLKDFNIKGDFTEVFQPKVSILLECKSPKFKYIHRGTGEIAFRLIGKRNKNLFNLIQNVGPIVAPSANKESEKPAETVNKAKEYFGSKVDGYLDGGKKIGVPSTLIRLKDNKIEILRQGIIKISKNKK